MSSGQCEAHLAQFNFSKTYSACFLTICSRDRGGEGLNLVSLVRPTELVQMKSIGGVRHSSLSSGS